MDNLFRLEAADDLHDRVRLAYVREELIAEALALRRAAHETGDVNELDGRWDDDVSFYKLRERFETLVGHWDDADVRLA